MHDDYEEFRDLVQQFRHSVGDLHRRGVQAASAELTPFQVDIAPVPASVAGSEVAEPPAALPGGTKAKTLAVVRDELGDCQRCELAKTRTSIVFGCGSETASLMFVGEAPGADEDRTGEPFVGRAGQLLDKMIVAMGFRRESVYIANVLKCRPPNNRDPKTEEVASCEGFLAQQIAVVQPAVIVTLGKPAAHLLLKSTASMRSLRGVWQESAGIAVMPTYHPAYLLRDPTKKRETWADLQQVMKFLSERGLSDAPKS